MSAYVRKQYNEELRSKLGSMINVNLGKLYIPPATKCISALVGFASTFMFPKFKLKLFDLQNSTLEKGGGVQTAPLFVCAVSKRAKFTGQVAGMLHGPDSTDVITDKLISDIWSACTAKNNTTHHDALWRATALLTSIHGMYAKSK